MMISKCAALLLLIGALGHVGATADNQLLRKSAQGKQHRGKKMGAAVKTQWNGLGSHCASWNNPGTCMKCYKATSGYTSGTGVNQLNNCVWCFNEGDVEGGVCLKANALCHDEKPGFMKYFGSLPLNERQMHQSINQGEATHVSGKHRCKEEKSAAVKPKKIGSNGKGRPVKGPQKVYQKVGPPPTPCFSGNALVDTWTANGDNSTSQCQDLRRGALLRLPGETFHKDIVGKVKFLTITDTEDAPMIQFAAQEGSGITPWHPIEIDDKWQFPQDLFDTQDPQPSAIFNGTITGNKLCNMMLEKEGERQHARVYVGGVIACTLGHELTADKNEVQSNVISHEFFGSYEKVSTSLDGHDDAEGLVLVAGSHYNNGGKTKSSFTFVDEKEV